MTAEKEFKEKIGRLGSLVGELDQAPGGSKAAARELVQLLMEVHDAGLERILEIIAASGPAGMTLIDKLGQDTIVRSLLLLYSLHPDELETRVLKALDTAGARLRKFDAGAELVSIHDGAIEIRLHTTGHSCGSTTQNLKAITEECIYDQAPDLTSLSIRAPEDESVPGFVPLENLLNHAGAASAIQVSVEVDGAD